jgi:drug/metabolite transporter (DMT)-like permease
LLGVLLALAAAACYGVSNFIGPLISRELPVIAVLVAGQAVALVVSAAVVLADPHPLPGSAAIVAGLVAGAGNALGLAAFYRAAELAPLSIVAPLSSIAAVLPVTIGLATGDELAPAQAIGIPLALVGIGLASRREPLDARPGASAATGNGAGRGHAAGIALALLAALGFGTFLAGMAPAAEDGVFWAVAVSRASLLARLPPGDLPKAAVPGLLLFLGTAAYSFATQEGALSVISVLGSLFPVVTVALALIFLRERLGSAQRAGVAATLVAVVLLSTR